MAKKKYTDADGLAALLARIRQKFVSYALLEDLVEVQESLLGTISDLNDKVDSNTTNIAAKASKSVVDLLQAIVSKLQTQVDSLNSTLKEDFRSLAAADESLQTGIEGLESELQAGIEALESELQAGLDVHDDEMRRLAYHIGLPEYSVTQMMAWKNAAESWGKYKDNTQLTIWPRVDMSAVVNGGSLFAGATALTKVYPMNTSAMTSAATMFTGCTALTQVDAVDLSSCTDMRSMFYQCAALESVGITGMKSGTVQMRGMFQDCAGLKEVSFPSGGWRSVADADVIFYGCTALERIRLGLFVVTGSAKQMFAKCPALRVIEGSIDVGQCSDAALMFQGCKELTQVELNMIGYGDAPTWDFGEMRNWGHPDLSDDGGLSLYASMGHASASGGAPVTLRFHADTKARLEERGYIATLTTAGFTIA